MGLIKRAVTIGVDKGFNLNVQACVGDYVKTVGSHHIYLEKDKVYIGFETYQSIRDIAEILKTNLKVETRIVGGLILVIK